MKTTQKVFFLRAALLAASLALMDLHVSGASFGLTNFADAFVTTGPSGNLSISNYGGAGALGISASGSSQGEFQSVLKFDLSSAKSSFDSIYGAGQWSPQSITLQLTTTAPNNGIFNSNLLGNFAISLMQNTGWTEGTGVPISPGSSGITFSSLPSFESGGDQSLGVFSFAGGNSGTSVFTLTLSPDLLADAVNGSILSIRMYAADSSVSYLFDSRSFGTTSFRPLLTLTVPEPGSLALAVAGLALLGGRRLFTRRTRT